MAGIDSKFDKAYAGKSVEELADAPVAALNGVSDSDAEHLMCVPLDGDDCDRGTNKFFLWAQATAKLAE